MPAAGHANPACSGAASSATRVSRRATNSAKPSTIAGRSPYSAKNCCIVSRRPGLSAQMAMRSALPAMYRLSAASGSAARRSTVSGGNARVGAAAMPVAGVDAAVCAVATAVAASSAVCSGASTGTLAAGVSSMRPNALSPAKKASTGTNICVGGSSGRARSPRNSR